MKKLLLTAVSLLCLEKVALAESTEEKILGYQPTREGITFHVYSGGCTTQNDFDIALAKDPSTSVAQIKLLRNRPDTCLAFIPTGTKVSFTYEQLGMSPSQAFEVTNPNGVVRGWNWKDPAK